MILNAIYFYPFLPIFMYFVPGGTTKKQLKIMKSAEIQAISADFFVSLNTKSRRFMK